MTPLFTLSRQDLYDYLRCPKIVAIKTYKEYKEKNKPKERTVSERRQQPELSPQTKGRIGELATEFVFSGKIWRETINKMAEESRTVNKVTEESRSEEVLLAKIEKLGIRLDNNIRGLVKQSLKGLRQIKSYLEKEYGELSIIGKGETRYGIIPCYGQPDFVAFASRKDSPILIEVKEIKRPSPKADDFQASYYNTMKKTVGVVVMEEREEDGRPRVVPETIIGHDSETLIIYPLIGKYRRVRDTIDISPKLVKEVWKAKQLGLIGKSPHTECDKSCPHFMFGLELPEDDLEVAKPLPLIFAIGQLERRIDIDLEYMGDYITRMLPLWFRLRSFGIDDATKRRVAEIMADKFGLDVKEVFQVLKAEERHENLSRPYYDVKSIVKEMADEVEPWKKLLGARKLQSSLNSILGVMTRIYRLPEGSNKYIRRSWKRW